MLQSLLRTIGPDRLVIRVHLDHLMVRTHRVEHMSVRERLNVMTAVVGHAPKLAAGGPFHGHNLAATTVIGDEESPFRRHHPEMLVEKGDRARFGALGIGALKSVTR